MPPDLWWLSAGRKSTRKAVSPVTVTSGPVAAAFSAQTPAGVRPSVSWTWPTSLKPWIARRDKLDRFVLRGDPRDLSRIWALDPDGTAHLEVPYRTLSRPPISAREQMAAIARLRELGRAELDEDALFALGGADAGDHDTAAATTRRARRDRQRRTEVPVRPRPAALPPQPSPRCPLAVERGVRLSPDSSLGAREYRYVRETDEENERT